VNSRRIDDGSVKCQQLPINAVTGEVKSARPSMSGNPTNQELAITAAAKWRSDDYFRVADHPGVDQLGQHCRLFQSALNWLARKRRCPVDVAQELTSCKAVVELLQLRVFGFGLLQNRNARIGVFPKYKKIAIGCATFGPVALHRIGARQAKMW
jgi:hypothetical protein